MNSLEYYHLHLSSSDSRDIYPNNTASDFRVQLPRSLRLQGKWEGALLNISYWPQVHSTSRKPDELYICSDLVGSCYALNSLHPVLKRISMPDQENAKINIHFASPDFLPLIQNTVQNLRIYIIDNTSQSPSFIRKDLYCTLLLRRLA